MLDRIGGDKYLHVICSLLLTFAIGVTADIWLVHWQASVFGCVMAFLIGIAKEVWDRYHGGTMDGQDILADLIGCLMGFIVTLL